MSERPSVKVLHDRKGVCVYLPNDCIDLNVDEALSFASAMQDAAEQADKNIPPAPGPFFLPGHGEKGEYFATCDQCYDGQHSCMIQLAGYEVKLDEMKLLRDWFNKVLEYHDKPTCLKEEET